jgi:carbamoyltransferase
VRILGLSAYFHDAAACVVEDGEIVAAAQEERFTRVKNDAGFPNQAITACLDAVGSDVDGVDLVAYYEKPHRKFERILATARDYYPEGRDAFGAAWSRWTHQKLWTPAHLRNRIAELSPSGGERMRWDGRVLYARHHQSHAASAYYPSPFDSAAIITVDGVGEWATASLASGRLDERGVPGITFFEEIRWPHSIGMLYSAFTRYLGFEVNEGEYKMMGLAPYGAPKHTQTLLDEVIHLRDDGSFALNLDYFAYHHDLEMFSPKLPELFGMPMRDPDEPLEQIHMDVAASVQEVTELVVAGLARRVHERTGERRVCMAGGVALNCVANGKLLREGPFDDIWVQPAAGDAGGAVGAALFAWHDVLGERRPRRPNPRRDGMHGSLLGPAYDEERCREALDAATGFEVTEVPDDELVDHVADLLSSGNIVGWFQGRMEFGPRALGSRSILADPRSPTMQKELNLRVKFRESFRPLAPSVLRERVLDWFELDGRPGSELGAPGAGYDSPYMLLVAPVAKDKRTEVTPDQELVGTARIDVPRSEVPSVTHVDLSARVQTVSADDNPRYHALLGAFEQRTGVPVLVNTSFNVRGEPIVCTPEDAVRCFLATRIDVLVLGRLVATKVPDRVEAAVGAGSAALGDAPLDA